MPWHTRHTMGRQACIHFCTPYPPLLVHVVIKRPLRRSRDDIATRRCRFHKKQIDLSKKSNEGKVRGLPGQYSREFVDQSCQIFCQFEGHHPYLRSHLNDTFVTQSTHLLPKKLFKLSSLCDNYVFVTTMT